MPRSKGSDGEVLCPCSKLPRRFDERRTVFLLVGAASRHFKQLQQTVHSLGQVGVVVLESRITEYFRRPLLDRVVLSWFAIAPALGGGKRP
jgi:hypothetical protein